MIDPTVVVLLLVLVLSLTAYALLGGADYGGGLWDLLASGPTAARQRATIAHHHQHVAGTHLHLSQRHIR